jgi:hypothetical protein
MALFPSNRHYTSTATHRTWPHSYIAQQRIASSYNKWFKYITTWTLESKTPVAMWALSQKKEKRAVSHVMNIRRAKSVEAWFPGVKISCRREYCIPLAFHWSRECNGLFPIWCTLSHEMKVKMKRYTLSLCRGMPCMLSILLIFSPRPQALSLSGLKLKNALHSGASSTPNAFHSLSIGTSNPKRFEM